VGNYTGCWYTWCDHGGTSASTALTTAANINGVWTSWTTSGTTNLTTACSTVNTIWLTWTEAGTTSSGITSNVAPGRYVDARTPDQRAADEARYAQQLEQETRRLADANAKHQAASERARTLLLSMLEVHQREQLQRDKFFEVIARHSKRRYRIRQGTHGNVRLLDAQGREVTRYCGQPSGVPTEDCMLAQKLQIEHDEEAFLRAANASRVA
jgi:hypothetical protein